MLLNGVGILMTAILIFALGAVFGARMVYRFRHVTTKPLHQSLLNSLQLQTQMLDRNVDSFADNDTVFIELEEKVRVTASTMELRICRETKDELLKMTNTINENQPKGETWN